MLHPAAGGRLGVAAECFLHRRELVKVFFAEQCLRAAGPSGDVALRARGARSKGCKRRAVSLAGVGAA